MIKDNDYDCEDEEDEILVVDVLLDKSLLTKHPLGNTSVPRSRAGKAALAADVAHKLNEQVFQSNHADILKSDKYPAGAKAKLLREKNFDTVAVSISKDGRKITIAGNVKKRTEWSKRFWHPSEYGLQETQHRDVIASVLKDHFPELNNSKIDVVQPKVAPKTAEGNAKFHAEQQLVSFIGEVSDHPIGVNKPPCQKCLQVLDEVGVISVGKEGESLAADKVKNWIEQNPDEIEHGFNVRNKKITFDHNLHGHTEGFKEFVKGMTNVSVPTQVPKNADLKTKITSHAKNHLTINVKPQVGISAGAGLENVINNITETTGRAHAEVGHASAGSYETKCSTGLYARASTAEASASWNVFSASANGPAAAAGLHSGVGTWAAAYANAELARAEAVAGPMSVGVGLNANTGASIGLDGVSASFLGFGFSVGPKMSIRTPVADASCSIM